MLQRQFVSFNNCYSLPTVTITRYLGSSLKVKSATVTITRYLGSSLKVKSGRRSRWCHSGIQTKMSHFCSQILLTTQTQAIQRTASLASYVMQVSHFYLLSHFFYLHILSSLTAILQVNLGWPVFIEAKDDGSGGDSWNYRSCKAPVKIITTNKPTSSFFTDRMPFLSPTQQCQSTDGKIHSESEKSRTLYSCA